MSLMGRLQTRVLLLICVGIPWVGALTPLLNRSPLAPRPATLGTSYRAAYTALAVVLSASVLWEVLYHRLTRSRWDRDWPSLLALLAGINEGVISWALCVHLLHVPLPPAAYAVLFGGLWALIWAIMQGPMRVLRPRWRFNGAAVWQRPGQSALSQHGSQRVRAAGRRAVGRGGSHSG